MTGPSSVGFTVPSICCLTLFLIALAFADARADTQIEWSPGKDGPEKTYVIDGVKLSVSSAENSDGDSPKLTVSSQKGITATVYGAKRFLPDIPVRLRVTRLDPTHSSVDIMFGVYTGGAHCCIAIKILSLINDDWKIMDFGDWDGDEMPEPDDSTKNGMVILTFYDDSFLYAFAPYAASFAPLKLFEVLDGNKVDVSGSPALLQLHRQNMEKARELCATHNNGGCAAYVASAARMGMFPEAWDFMLRNYDKNSDWALEFCDIQGAGKCARNISFTTFPKALDWFLHKHGYLTK